MKNKFIIIGLFLSFLMLTIPFNNNVSASSIKISISFESGVLNNDYTDAYLTTHQSTGTFKVAGSPIKSGVRSFRFGGNGYYNFSYSSSTYFTNMSFFLNGWSYTSGTTTLNFYNNTLTNSKPIIVLLFNSNGSVSYTDYAGVSKYFISSTHDYRTVNYNYFYFNIENNIGDCSYGGTVGSWSVRKIGTVRNATAINLNFRIDRLYIATVVSQGMYVDDLNITVSDSYVKAGEIPQENIFYVNVIDGMTGEPILGVVNYCFVGPLMSGTYVLDFQSDLWAGHYCYESGVFRNPFLLDVSFIEGSYHWLNVSCFITDGAIFNNYSQKIPFHAGQTLNVVLYTYELGEWENENYFTSDGLTYGIRTDKFIYQYQEQVRIQIKMPTVEELQAKGKNINNYWVHGKNTSFLSGDIYNEQAFLFGSWQDIDSFTPIRPPTGIQEMRFGIDYKTTVFWFIPIWEWLCSVYINIYDYATPYIPHGNITTITPLSPVVGETVTINFNANNNGNINIFNIGTQKIIYDEDFIKPVGNGYITYSFSGIGYYRIQLKVWSGTSLHLNDTHYLWVNGSGSDYENWGYKTEYLTVEDNFLISGYDYLVIFYKSKINDTEIRVKSPSGSYMPFGTTVSNITSGTYKVKLPDWVRLGEYNITMNTSSGVLFETFKVVADEFNFAEFTSNSYSLNSTISFYLRHNKRCKVIILKDGVSYGQDYFFDNLTMPEGTFNLVDKSFFTVGVWTLELWETNNRIPRKLLSSDTTNIYYEQVKQPKQTFDSLLTISAPFTYIAGTILTLFCLILPALLIRKANIQSEILKYVPLFSGIFGFILSCMLGFFPWYAIFGLILVLVIVLAVIYQSKKGQ